MALKEASITFHIGDFRLDDLGRVLASGLKEAETEKKNFEQWLKTKIPLQRLASWVN